MKRQLMRPVATALFIALCGGVADAQKRAPVSRNPVKDATAARAELFTLPEEDSAYYFRADLPGDNFLTIRFGKLSYWSEGSLPDIFATARLAWRQVQDSFAGATTSRRISVHVPPSNYPAIAAISEFGTEQRTFIIKGSGLQPVRIALDTITVLKTLAPVGADTESKRQVGYTFLLKDLAEIEELAGNADLIRGISAAFDSLVAAKQKRWKRPDAPYHRMEALYNARSERSGAQALRVITGGSVLDNFDYNAELGVSFITGTIGGLASMRLSYYIPSTGVAEKGFVALSLSSISFAAEENGALNLRAQAFLNFEIGSVFSGTNGRIPLYRTSVGFGYKVASENEGPYKFRFRGFFNYSVSKAITVTPDFYIIPKDGDKEGRAFSGITLSIRLF